MTKEPSEIEIQTLFRSRVRIQCPAVHLVAIPNAGKRTRWAAQQAKREGMAAGFPDMMALWKGGIAAIEFKAKKGRLSENQKEWLERLDGLGIPATVARSAEEALDFLREHGAPFLGQPRSVESIGSVPDHLAALQLLVNRCDSLEAKKELIVTAGACEAIGREEAYTILTANHLETV